MTFATLLCRISLRRGGDCETVRCFESGRTYLKCIHCGLETTGFDLTLTAADTPGTAPYYSAALDELLEAELELHGGG